MLAFLLLLQLTTSPTATLSGTVVDASGAAVPGADVQAADGAHTAHTGRDGRFAIEVAGPPPWRLRVSLAGFAPQDVTVAPADAPVRVVLEPSGISEAVTVTAWRGPGGASAAAAPITVLGREAIAGGATYTLDDALRQVAGFSLFRRTSSRTSNPTTQGVTLRGLSASGASRTLVLLDGAPLNDPFGGWIAWNRVPMTAIDRVEVMRGGGSDLYGADAIGGVIQVVSADPERRRVSALVEGGSEQTARASVFAAGARNGWFGSVAGEAQRTGGYVPLAPPARGAVDTPAGSRSRVASLTGGRAFAAGARVRARAAAFHETRTNGTPLQTNRTTARDANVQGRGLVAGGALTVTAGGTRQTYDQAFSTIAVDRSREDLSRTQRVPSDSWFGAAQWSRGWTRGQLLGGAETRVVSGTTAEIPYARGVPGATAVAGGRQQTGGAFLQMALMPSEAVSVLLGARVDRATIVPNGRDSHGDTAFSPRLSLGWRLAEPWTARVSVTRAFRTPTLNERYRGFRVGNVVTGANDALGPERLTGVEGSLAWTAARGSARAVWFWNDVRDVVANVTISSTPALIVRLRQNAGRARSQGLELESAWRALESLTLRGSLAVTRARLIEAPEGLSDRTIPQVPAAQASAGLDWRRSGWTATGLLRVTGRQFDDDRNDFVLRTATTLDAQVERQLGAGVGAFVAAENLFDADVEAGRTPLLTLGQPRTVRGGVRIRFSP